MGNILIYLFRSLNILIYLFRSLSRKFDLLKFAIITIKLPKILKFTEPRLDSVAVSLYIILLATVSYYRSYNYINYFTLETFEYRLQKIERIKISGEIERIVQGKSYIIIRLKNINPKLTATVLKRKIKKIDIKYIPNQEIFTIGDKISAIIQTTAISSNFPQDHQYERYLIAKDAFDVKIIKLISIEKIKTKKYNFSEYKSKIEKRIGFKSRNTGILVALLTGNTSFIDRQDLQNIRKAGCAHILAISGLHMSFLCYFIFSITRKIISLSPYIALQYSTKNISYIVALFICFLYLFLSDFAISALRSFLMLTFIILASYSNRFFIDHVRIIYIIAVSILLINANYLFSPSFQMSFMAALALVSGYSSFKMQTKFGIINYIIKSLYSSLLAILATSFYEMYNFHQYSLIGFLSNIFVIFLTEFFLLPVTIIGFFYDICNPEAINFLYKLGDYGAYWIIVLTRYFASLKYSCILAKRMTDMDILIITICLIMFFTSKNLVKIISAFVLLATFLFYLQRENYSILFDKHTQYMLLKNELNYYVEIGKNQFLRQQWLRNLGTSKFISYDNIKNNNNIIGKAIKFSGNNIIYFYKGNEVIIKQKKSYSCPVIVNKRCINFKRYLFLK